MKHCGDLKEQEKGGEEKEETQKWPPMNELMQPVGISVEVLLEFIVMRNTKDFPAENKGSVCERQSRRRKIRQVTYTAATKTGACGEACVIISTKALVDAPAERSREKMREAECRE